jgi:hypothetical protein
MGWRSGVRLDRTGKHLGMFTDRLDLRVNDGLADRLTAAIHRPGNADSTRPGMRGAQLFSASGNSDARLNGRESRICADL